MANFKKRVMENKTFMLSFPVLFLNVLLLLLMSNGVIPKKYYIFFVIFLLVISPIIGLVLLYFGIRKLMEERKNSIGINIASVLGIVISGILVLLPFFLMIEVFLFFRSFRGSWID